MIKQERIRIKRIRTSSFKPRSSDPTIGQKNRESSSFDCPPHYHKIVFSPGSHQNNGIELSNWLSEWKEAQVRRCADGNCDQRKWTKADEKGFFWTIVDEHLLFLFLFLCYSFSFPFITSLSFFHIFVAFVLTTRLSLLVPDVSLLRFSLSKFFFWSSRPISHPGLV